MKMIYAFGSYGSGNLGDDAIFEGLCQKYREFEITQIYACQPTHSPAVQISSLLKDGFANVPEKLIIGGGGLFFGQQYCDNANSLADLAISNNIIVEVEAIGLESSPISCHKSVIELFAKCSKISTRSGESQKIAHDLGYESVLVHDFAYYMIPDKEGAERIMQKFDDNLPVIGIATAGGIDNNLDEPIDVVKMLIKEFNVLHLPHVRHLMSPRNGNEAAKGLIIWSSLGWEEPKLFKRYKCLPYPDSPRILLGIYNLISAVVSYRYHPLIFAELSGIPCYARYGDGRKIPGYFEDHIDTVFAKDNGYYQTNREIPGNILNYFKAVIL